ncbi:MAG: hypothetical protein M3N51_03995, partial [Actinomycetota bacterium]|nr:hypothetical protein [Actinomycetota bacterium]
DPLPNPPPQVGEGEDRTLPNPPRRAGEGEDRKRGRRRGTRRPPPLPYSRGTVREGLRLAILTLAAIFLVGFWTLEEGASVAGRDFLGTVVLSLPFLLLAAWARVSGDRVFALMIAASAVLLAVRFEIAGWSVDKGDLVPIPIEVGVAYLLFRLGRLVWRRWAARELGM